jgi:hypothetical protein
MKHHIVARVVALKWYLLFQKAIYWKTTVMYEVKSKTNRTGLLSPSEIVFWTSSIEDEFYI